MDDLTTENVIEGFGLMDYGARMYDPALGRFTSADTIIPSTQGVQGWDRYAYVNNNPVRYTDPTGHICVNDDGDGDVAMAGNCGGGANVHYNGSLQGSPTGWTGNGGGTQDDDQNPSVIPTPVSIPTSTLTSTPTLCPIPSIECLPTATSTPDPTPTLWKPYGQQAGENVANTVVAAASTVVPVVSEFCFGPGDLSGASGCGELVDMAAQAAPVFGIPAPQVPYGQVFDTIIASSHVAKDNLKPVAIQVTPKSIIVTTIAILIAIPIIPPFP